MRSYVVLDRAFVELLVLLVLLVLVELLVLVVPVEHQVVEKG
jgi:hypothetical protein